MRHIRVRRHLRNLPKTKKKEVSVEEYHRRLNDKDYLSNYDDFNPDIENVFQRCPKCNFRNLFKINLKIPCTKSCERCNTPIHMDYNKK